MGRRAPFGPDGVEATLAPTWSADGNTGLPSLWLARDVRDTQVIDVAGSPVGRVAEIFLEPTEGALSVVAVDLGTRGVLRAPRSRAMGRRCRGATRGVA